MAVGVMMTIDTSNVQVEQLRFVNGPNTDLRVLSGSGNVIRNNSIGTPSDVVDTCVSAGVTRASELGIYVGPLVAGSIATPAVWIYENDISCHAVYGILINGADGVVIGINHLTNAAARNYIGTNYQQDTLGNGGGIALQANGSNGARYNQISNN